MQRSSLLGSPTVGVHKLRSPRGDIEEVGDPKNWEGIGKSRSDQFFREQIDWMKKRDLGVEKMKLKINSKI